MYECKINENGISGEIVFQGSLTIKNAASIKECLSDVLFKVQDLFIDHNNASEFDIIYMQLLVALYNSATLYNKTVKWSYPKLFITYVKDAGLSGIKCLTNNEIDKKFIEANNG
ncbi:MAG: hypothetical protein WCA84_05310 [Ignavibacteriaceae bacterium]|jgi:anti-anti-sigma regulatory factor